MALPAQKQAMQAHDVSPPQVGGGRFAANDNQPSAANDNGQHGDEQIPQTYPQPSEAQTRPMRRVEVERGGTVRSLGTTAQVAGAGTQVAGKVAQTTGKTMRAVGKGMDAGGTAMIRAGTAMSSTGVGAIVGVPTVVLGAGVKVMGIGTQATGAGVQAAGKTANKVGKGVRKGGTAMKRLDRIGRRAKESEQVKKVLALAKRLPGPLGKAAKYGGGAITTLVERRKVTKANMSIYSSGFSLWVGIQLPIALVSLALLGVAYTLETIKTEVTKTVEGAVGETVTYYLGQAYLYTVGAGMSAGDWLFEQIFGFSLEAIVDPTNWFVATYYMTVLLGWAMLLMAATIYLVHLVNPFTGKGWTWKMGGFLISACMYLIPGFNVFPWFALYAACVWKNPE